MSDTRAFPPPTAGWLAAGNNITPVYEGAEVLDNWFPTARGARLRRGSRLHGTLDDVPVTMFTYLSGDTSDLLCATETDIFDMTAPADPEVTPTAALASQTSGDWSTAQISTTGGDFLVGVNGSDDGWVYNGSTFEEYGGGTYALTGVTSSTLSHVGKFASRLFFVEGGSLDIWYLPVDSIAGTVTKFPMGAVFTKSSAVLATGTWSTSAGDQLQDLFYAVSVEGEVAVYSGTNPASWSKVGVYEIGRPVDKHATIKVGGDVLFATKVGLVPLTQAVQRDLAQMSESALSYKIEDAWRETITFAASSHPIPIVYWREESLILIGTGNTTAAGPVSFVANPRTGSWARYVGWDVQCAAVSDENLYFGSDDNCIYEGEVTGNDNGTAYAARYVPVFSMCDSPSQKHVHQVNAIFRGTVSVSWAASAYTDFTIPDPVDAPTLPSPDTSAIWGSFVWGSFIWGGNSLQVTTNTWKNVRSKGFAVAPVVITESNSTAAPDIEIMATQIRYEVGSVL